MRYSDILNEMPMAHFGTLGDMTQPGSMEDADRRAINNPKWQAKLTKQFSQTAEPLNLYIMNAVGRTLDHSHNYTTTDGPQSIKKTIQVSAFSVSDFGGFYQPHDFETNFGFLPPEYKTAVNVLLVQNDGSDKLPLTPWMVGHRIIHAISNEARHWSRNDEVPRHYDEYAREMGRTFGRLCSAVNLDSREVVARVATMKSAKVGFKASRMGEFYIELATQAFLFGRFVFDLSSFDIEPGERKRIEDGIETARQSLTQALDGCVGKLIVF
jgi:hypothetical protein